MKNTLIAVLATGLLALGCLGCQEKKVLPEKTLAANAIQELLIENGNMPGGNRIDIHTFEIKQIEPGGQPNTARVQFQIDFTRHPTSGLAPEYQTGEPMRQTEDHQATLLVEKGQWSVTDVSLH